MRPEPRRAIAYGLGLVVGTVLFFLIFAAVFVGSWILLFVFLFGYTAAGALGVRVAGLAPHLLALTLAMPSIPWVFWLFLASAAEAGLLRALLWPAVAVVAGGLGWLGGQMAALPSVSRPS